MEDQEISIFPERKVTYANFWQRLAAVLLDGLILWIPDMVIRWIMGNHNLIMETYKHDVTAAAIITTFLTALIGWLYCSLMESGPSQATVGKQALNLKVTDLAGNRISFSKATGRHFGKYLSTLILFLGYFMMVEDRRKQTLHDKMAGTLVVKKNPVF